MKSSRRLLITACAGIAFAARAEITPLQESVEQVKRWNGFVDALYSLHQKQLADKAVREQVTISGYRHFPDFYREVAYLDDASNRRLSVVQWEREHPNNIHSIQVFIHGEDGKLVRDYSATYLPWARNAPIQTLVRFYHYGPDVRSFRVFDASGNFLYEDCKGTLGGKPVEIGLDTFDMIKAENARGGILESKAYKVCFTALPGSAGKYLDPQ